MLYKFISFVIRFLGGKKPLITRQKPSTETVAHAHGLDNPTFVSADVANTILHTPISNQSTYLKTPESKICIFNNN